MIKTIIYQDKSYFMYPCKNKHKIEMLQLET